MTSAASGSGEDSIGFRELETSEWRIAELPNHRRRVTIVHRPLAGLTPVDLLWWFGHIEGTCQVDGAP